ncbi:YihA family ribosome biogenesis GTP-binding protein [Hazenella sp. IB182357]|uniref:Probable GTP-binding protein EngB n=1 Tax=Polycladospora coralii TaxID=2771432 RepID=A0A926NAS3_9BACL|nr:ribosome biogenesis GTP-binding protein YihA/YsxC [Polycladospora coralii]MBD1371810.1 YihA family ribosome biogenesis GTP-binding protein [Polycladospora coralii]MBS7529271.1 ribosome biogenesis GTP-binding protein YihA/YsxC [Polycladospora coralii]
MKVTKAEIVISAVKPTQYPDDALPEIALAGRSNVGKSSLINTLIQRKKLARTSSTPGKTQTINFYRINDSFHFADVPGYGFARVPKSVKAQWGKMMETYFTSREPLKAVIQLIDIRHKPSEDDYNMYHFLKYHELPVIIVATKCDKVTKGHWQKHIKIIKEALLVDRNDPVILFSSQTSYGKEKLWNEIYSHLNHYDKRDI